MAQQYGVFDIRANGLSGTTARVYEAPGLGMMRAFDSMKTGSALLDGFSPLQIQQRYLICGSK